MIIIDLLLLENVELISMQMFNIIFQEEIKTTSVEGIKTMLSFYSTESILKRIKEPDNIFYQFQYNKEIVGFAEMENNHIVSLFVIENHRKKGISTKFIEYLKEIKKEKVDFTVYASPTSIEFYSKCGFEQQSVNCKESYGLLYMPMILENNKNNNYLVQLAV